MRRFRILRLVWILIVACISGAIYGQTKEAILLYNKGQKSYQQRFLIQASVDYTDAIALTPDYIEAIEARGLIFIELGEEKAAIKDLEKVLLLDATRLLPKIRLIDLYDSLDMNNAGIRISTLMLNENSENLGAGLMKRGRFYEKAGEIEKAKQDYTDFLNIDDDYYQQFKKKILEKIKQL